MVNYRRARIPGATYFFTVTLRDRRADWLIARISLLRAAFRPVRRQRPYQLDAVVVLPDHLHAVWTLPPGDASIAVIDKGATKDIDTLGQKDPVVAFTGGEKGLMGALSREGAKIAPYKPE